MDCQRRAAPGRGRRVPPPRSTPRSSARTSAGSSTSAPRAVLISTAWGRIRRSSRSPMNPRVSAVSGACRLTTSAWRRRSSRATIGGAELGLDRGRRSHRIVVDDRGIERPRPPRHLAPDAPEADQADGLPRQLDAAAAHRPDRPFTAANRRVEREEMSKERQDQEQRVLGHADGRPLGGERDGDGGAAAGIDVDVVVPHPLVLHEAETWRGSQELLVDAGGCHQQEIRLRHEAKQLLPFPAGDHQEAEASGHQLRGDGAQIIRDRFAIDDREGFPGLIVTPGSGGCVMLFDPLLAHALVHFQNIAWSGMQRSGLRACDARRC